MPASFKVESAVKDRYSEAASTRVETLCCPVQYDPRYLKVIPQEILDRDYGCGDPSQYVSRGDTVLDLGSGAGKICFIASQVVGPEGRVIGVDMNDDMLALARGARKQVGEAVGWQNVEFRKGRIQDLALDLEVLQETLQANPIDSAAGFLAAEAKADELRHTRPLVPSNTIDVVVSNCVLNLVSPRDKGTLFQELFRVLKPGGRAVISDIVSDSVVPEALQNDPELWSGCISGAWVEGAFLDAFRSAGFQAVELLKRDSQPWRTVHGIDFRSVTVRAYKPLADSDSGTPRYVIYRGPFRSVTDDAGRCFERGRHHAVSPGLAQTLTKGAYRDHFIAVQPNEPTAPSQSASPTDISNLKLRPSQTTPPLSEFLPVKPSSGCCEGSGCC